MIQTKTNIKDYTKGKIPTQLILFALPLFLSNILQVVYNMVDMIVVEYSMSTVGLSAVAVGGDVSGFMTFIAMGFSAAGQVLIAQFIGENKRERLGLFISTLFRFLMIAALVLSAVCFLFRNPILRAMHTPEASYSEALAYSTVCMLGLVFIYGYNAISAVLRGMGDAKHPFIFICIAALLNVALDLLFVLVFHMGAMGAALATVISQGISFLCCAAFLYKNQEKFELKISAADLLKSDRSMLFSLLKLGTPMAIKSAAIHFSKLFVNSWINSYGLEVSGFAGIANKVNSISVLFSNSLNAAGSSMVGQNIAAKQFARVKTILRTMFVITLSIATLLSAFILIFPETFFGLFTSDNAVMAVAMEYLPVAVMLFFGSALRAPMNSILNGSGNYKINFVTAILDGIVMRIGLSLLFGLVFDMQYIGFWIGDALAGFTPFFIGVAFYFSGIWKKGRN